MNQPSTIARIRRLLLIGAFVLVGREAFGGGGPTGCIVVYDPSDRRSVTVANAYQKVRDIPEMNMVPHVFPGVLSRTTAWDFMSALRATLAERGLANQVQSVALIGVVPLNGVQSNAGGAVFSLHSFIYLSPNYSQGSFPVSATARQNAFPALDAFDGPSPAGTVAMDGSRDFGGQRYWPVSSVGFMGKGGSSPREALEFVARGKAADGAKPDGTIYWALNNNIRSRTRERQVAEVAGVWSERGMRFAVTEEQWVTQRDDVVGGIVGVERFVSKGNRYLPGAWVDHLTSNGGGLDGFTNTQTPCTEWLRLGADGSSGTMWEPYAIAAKFPHAHIHTHLRAGASLAEAFWQSIAQPAEIISVGDPLMQPFADFPVVAVESPIDGAVVSGSVEVVVVAEATGGKALAVERDLYIDGRRAALGDDAIAQRNEAGFVINTARLGDGWHELRVVVYNDDAVRTQSGAVVSILVDNGGGSLELSGPEALDAEGSGEFVVTPSGIAGLTSLTLRANGRVLATLPPTGGTATVSGLLGPLDGEWTVWAVGVDGEGREVWSNSWSTEMIWNAMPAVEGIVPGGAMADVRYFASTTTAGFNWDTTGPDVEAQFLGDATAGLTIRASNVPGVVFNTTTTASSRPGYEVRCWYFAPTDDWYEIGIEGRSLATLSASIDGVELAQRGQVFEMRRLAAGWHELVLRISVNDPAWAGCTVRMRGGNSPDFAIIPRGAAANVGDGFGDGVEVESITASANPVVGTSVVLTANAAVAGGGAGAGNLAYHWQRVGGPGPVEFSVNSAVGNASTTATFTRAGNYVIGVRVAAEAGSAVAMVPVLVQSTPLGMVATTSGVASVVSGGTVDVVAYTVDQFGERVAVDPVVPGAPTVQWSSTDPEGAIEDVSANGERARFRSMPGAEGGSSVILTATGVNGRSGSATTSAITVESNQAPIANSNGLIRVTSGSGPFDFWLAAQVTDPEAAERNAWGGPAFPVPQLSFRWSMVSQPAGSNLTFVNRAGAATSVEVTSPGTYSVRLEVTDQAGEMISETKEIVVGAGGGLVPLVSPGNRSAVLGETVVLRMPFPVGAGAYRWQTQAAGGAGWVDLAATVTTTAGTDEVTLVYGPVTTGDNGRTFRMVVTNDGVESFGPGGMLSVDDPPGGVIAVREAQVENSPRFVTEDAGSVTFTIERRGRAEGSVAVSWSLEGSDATPGEDFQGPNGEVGVFEGLLEWGDNDSSDRVLTVPLIADFLSESDESFSLFIDGATEVPVVIVDDDNAGRAAFADDSVTVDEHKGEIQIAVQRSGSFAGSLEVNYETVPGTALAGEDFTAAEGTLLWADGETEDRTLSIQMLSDQLVEGDETFSVKLVAGDAGFGGGVGVRSELPIIIRDAPFQRWQQRWWPEAVPIQAVYRDYASALLATAPLFQYRLNEVGGAEVTATDGGGGTVGTGTILRVGSGDFETGVIGPRPPSWPGLEPANTGLRLHATGSAGPLPRYTGGSLVNAGTANGIAAKLGRGFTFAAFVKTDVTNRVMNVVGGVQPGTNSVFQVTLNRAFNNGTTAVPHSVRVYLRTEGTALVMDYSVVLADLPSGSLCDGQWHHLAITVPPFTSANHSDDPLFYFDGMLARALDVRGTEGIGANPPFADFASHGLQIGADGSTPPLFLFDGDLDEVAFIPRVLGSVEVRDLVGARGRLLMPQFARVTGNPAGDGVPNLLKYALDLNPTMAVAGTFGMPELVGEGSAREFRFRRVPEADDITYRIERSVNLAETSWEEIWTSRDSPIGEDSPDLMETLRFDPDGDVFLRLRVTQP